MELGIDGTNLNQNSKLSTEKPHMKEDNPQKSQILFGIVSNVTSSSQSKEPSKIQYFQIHKLPQGHPFHDSIKLYYSKLVIPINSSFKKFWDILIEIILAYNVVTTLFFLAYSMPGHKMLIVDLICWIILLIDIPITFVTEIKTRKSKIARNFEKISKYYLKSWFIVDFLSILPFSQSKYAYVEYYLRMLRLLKLPGVLNITDGTGLSFLLTLMNVGHKEKNGKVVYSLKVRILASFIQIFIILIFLVYFFGCFWFWFQKTVGNYKYSHGNIDEDEFQDAYLMDEIGWEHVAIRSSYFMLTTISTIGYGDYLPKNIYEMAFMSCVMLFGVTMFAVVVGNFNSAIAFFSFLNVEDNIGKLSSWLDSIENVKGKMKKRLRKQIFDHFTYYFTADRLKNLAKGHWEFDENDNLCEITQEYVNEMPEEVYYEILETLFSDFIAKFKFYFTESRFKLDIIPFLQPRKFDQGSFISESIEDDQEVIFVLSGVVCIGFQFNQRFAPLISFEGGRTVLGDYSALTGNKNRFNFYAQTFLKTLVIPSEVFEKILSNHYKQDKINILQIAAQKEFTLRKLMTSYYTINDWGYQQVRNEKQKPRATKKLIIKKPDQDYSEENTNTNLSTLDSSIKDLSKKSSDIISTLSSIESGRVNIFDEHKFF